MKQMKNWQTGVALFVCFSINSCNSLILSRIEPFNTKTWPHCYSPGEDKPVLEMVCLPEKKKEKKNVKMICFVLICIYAEQIFNWSLTQKK